MPDGNQVVGTATRVPALPVAGNEAASLMEVISRAASDPSVDVEKLERLMSMYERITTSRAKAAFDAALAEMQPKLPVVGRHGAITIRDKNNQEKIIQSTPYALFEDINEAIAPLLAEYGFAVSFRTSAEAKVKVTCVLSHKLGHREETSLELMHDSTGSKNSVQAIGSSVSYGKRYTLCAILNISTRGEDDDGKTSVGTLTEDQLAELGQLIKDTKTNLRDFLNHMGAEAIFSIPATDFVKAKQALEAKKKLQEAKRANS